MSDREDVGTIIGFCDRHARHHDRESRLWEAMTKAMSQAYPSLSETERARIKVLLHRIPTHV